jgi:hypothetical protein
MLVLREAFFALRRFEELRKSTGRRVEDPGRPVGGEPVEAREMLPLPGPAILRVGGLDERA